ncbi:MAG: hypothetical protein R3C44_20890 [Chloroflexota bacterium]
MNPLSDSAFDKWLDAVEDGMDIPASLPAEDTADLQLAQDLFALRVKAPPELLRHTHEQPALTQSPRRWSIRPAAAIVFGILFLVGALLFSRPGTQTLDSLSLAKNKVWIALNTVMFDTEYGHVTVEMTPHDDAPSTTETSEVSVEVSHVETPYGTITIEKKSYGDPVNADTESAGAEPEAIREQLLQAGSLNQYSDDLNTSCDNNGVAFTFGTNDTLAGYELNWNGGSYFNYVICHTSSCTFKVMTGWSADYTLGYAYTVPPDGSVALTRMIIAVVDYARQSGRFPLDGASLI